jgi:dihydroxy-acid dehydratase
MADKQSSPTIDIKPRSREVTDGLEKAASRGMLRAVGMGDDDFAKSQIGVASSWNEITPCNLSLDRLAKSVKEGVFAAGGYPLEFGTISVSDGISMGHEGMHLSPTAWRSSCRPNGWTDRCCWPVATSRCPGC